MEQSTAAATAYSIMADAGYFIAPMPAHVPLIVGALSREKRDDVLGAANGLMVVLRLEAGKGILPHGITRLSLLFGGAA